MSHVSDDSCFGDKMEKTHVQAGTEKDNTQGVEVADDIVGNTVTSQHGGQEVGRASDSVENKVSIAGSLVRHLINLPVVVPVLHREEAEHASRLHGPLDILNKLISVVSLVLQSLSCNNRRLASIPPSTAANSEDSTTSQAVADDSEGVGQVGSTRLVQNKTRLKPHEHERQGDVEQQREQECQPPTNVVCSV